MSTGERSINQPEKQPSLSGQRLIRRTKLKELQNADQDPFQITKFVVKHHSADIKESFEDLEGAMTSAAGRIMSKRGMGKAVLCDLQGGRGRIQLYARVDELGEEAFAKFKETDIGDIVSMGGEAFKTKRGGISVKAHKVMLLSKSLQPLPEKLRDPTDKEMCYHQHYVGLIMNEDVHRAFRIRTAFIKRMRRYLDEWDYPEVETPVLSTISGGATTRPFITHHSTLDIDIYIHIATELNLKRLTVGGFERVYGIGHIFRDEGMDPKHSPEFTTIELYETYADFHDMMNIAGGVFSTATKETLGSYRVAWLGNEIDLTPGQKRMTMVDVVREYVDVDLEAIFDDEEACKAAEAKGINPEGYKRTWGTILYETFDQQVEEKLIQPIFITMYPVEVSPLTERSPKDPRLTERSELFINHCEFANAFSELNDPIDQRGRSEHELALYEMGNDEAGMMGEDFTNALEYGLPPTDDMGIDTDRCVTLLIDSDSIHDVILFPTIRPLDEPEPARRTAAGTNCAVPATEQGPVDFSKVEIEPLFQEFVDFETFTKSDFRAVEVKERTAVPKSKKLLKFVLDDGTGEDRMILSGIYDTYEPGGLVGKTLIAIASLPSRKMMGIDFCGMIISAVYREEGMERLRCLMMDDHIPTDARLYRAGLS